MDSLCLKCCEPLSEDGFCYDCDWFFKKTEKVDTTTLCPQCRQPFDKVCESCGIFYDEPEFIVTDFYNYTTKPARSYHRLDHFKEVLGQFRVREGKRIPP